MPIITVVFLFFIQNLEAELIRSILLPQESSCLLVTMRCYNFHIKGLAAAMSFLSCINMAVTRPCTQNIHPPLTRLLLRGGNLNTLK